VEKLTKHLHVIKLNLMGDGENEIDEEARRGTMEHLLRDQFFSTLIQHLEHLEFEAKKECTQIFNNVMRKGDAEGVFRANPRIVSQLVGFCSESGIALHCGNMLRELLRQEAIAEMVLMGNGGELFFQFFDFVELPNFDVASDAFDTFKILLTKHKALVTRFLTQSYEEVSNVYRRSLAVGSVYHAQCSAIYSFSHTLSLSRLLSLSLSLSLSHSRFIVSPSRHSSFPGTIALCSLTITSSSVNRSSCSARCCSIVPTLM